MAEKKSKPAQNNTEIIQINSEKIPEASEPKRGRGRPKSDPNKIITQSETEKKQLSLINKYLSDHSDNPTFAGVGRVLGYSCALDFINDAKKNNGPLGYALSKVEERYENELLGKFSTGAIFGLKQLGWADTQKVETEVKAVTVNISLAASLDDLAKVLNPIVEEPAI